MLSNDLAEVLRCFEQMGASKYRDAYLRKWNLNALENDSAYGIKLFLQYAAQRQGTPHAFEVAGIKSVNTCIRDTQPFAQIPNYFTQFYQGKLNLLLFRQWTRNSRSWMFLRFSQAFEQAMLRQHSTASM